MKNQSNKNSIAAQLRCPSGVKGIEIGEMMHVTNIGMTRSAIESLFLKDEELVLEIGFGNAKHLKEFFSEAKNLKYFGVDISEQMYLQAKKYTEALNEEIQLYLYEGNVLSFENATFDKVVTVNTIYFWETPTSFLNEIYRVLKPQGLLSICFASQFFMEQLPFVDNQFELYDETKIKKLIGTSSFLLEKITSKQEEIASKDGALVIRDYLIVVLKK